MTILIASAICTAIGFIAGAFWQRMRHRHQIETLRDMVISECARADLERNTREAMEKALASPTYRDRQRERMLS